jgi:hypothetical protein
VRSAELDEEVKAFLAQRLHRTAREFGKKPADPPLLEWGDRADFRAFTAEERPTIFVQREGADWWRIRSQVAHQVFHLLCTPPHTFHWTHEFFAVETAVRAMASIGELDDARRQMRRLREQADAMSLDAMLVTPLTVPYPPGLFGRAWLTGRELTSAVGWVSMKSLADCFGGDGKPDFAGWLHGFPDEPRRKLEAILGRPSPSWV